MRTERDGKRTAAGMVILAALAAFACGAEVGAAEESEASTMSPAALIAQMQQRADRIGGLSGVLGQQATVPAEGRWRGMPFAFRAPGSFVQHTGRVIETPGGPPVELTDRWRIFREGRVYCRSEGRTRMLRPGEAYRGLSYGDDPETLLLVNLMPKAWFGPFAGDLRVGPMERVDGTTYWTLWDVERPPPRGQTLLRYTLADTHMVLREPRRARKYYVNAESYVCERMVLAQRYREGDRLPADPFVTAAADVVAGDLRAVSGTQLPFSYTKRYFGESGVYQARRLTLHELRARGPASLAESDFDPYALTPGDPPVVMRPMERLEVLERLAETEREDVGLHLTLARKFTRVNHLEYAERALARADELAGESPGGDYAAVRADIWRRLGVKLVGRDLRQAPQLERIFTERAERFERLGDRRRAAQMRRRAEGWRELREDALARAEELNIRVEGEGE